MGRKGTGFMDLLMLSGVSSHAASSTGAFFTCVYEHLHRVTAVGEKSASLARSPAGGHKFHTQDLSTQAASGTSWCTYPIHIYLNSSSGPACSFCRNLTVMACWCLLFYPSTVPRLISTRQIFDLSGCPLNWTAFLSICNSGDRWCLLIKRVSNTGGIFLNWQ